MRTVVVILGSMTIALTACSSAGKNSMRRDKPDWVDGPSSQYSDARYLIGRGQAARADDAKDRARADLAKVFQVAVQEIATDKQTFTRKTGGNDKTVTESSLEIQRHIQTQTDKVLTGVKIGDLWQDPVTKEHHALAVLPRMQAGNSLRSLIRQLDEHTRVNMEKARQQEDLLNKIAAASRAVSAQWERTTAQRTLQVIDRSGIGERAIFNMAQLTADFEALLKRLKIKPKADNTELLRALSGGLATAGFLVEGGEAHNHILEATLNTKDLGQQDGWYWLRAALEISLTDSNGRVRGAHRWQFKESARDAQTARLRLDQRLDSTLKKELRDTIIGFTTSK